MKSVILVSPKLGIGGIQRSLTNMANWFVLNGYQVVFISCKREQVFYPLREEVELIVPKKDHPGSKGSLIRHYFYIIRFLRSTIGAKETKHIISFGDTFNPLVLLACLGLGKEVHVSDRTSPDYKFNWQIRLLKRFTYKSSSTYIAQTTRSEKVRRMEYGTGLNIKVIPNAVRTISEYDFPREKIILYVGRFAWEKSPKSLIEAFAQLPGRQGWQLHMLGDGPLLNEAKNLSRELEIERDVVFHGQVKDVDPFFARSAIFVLPSVVEGFPNALCEAMASGLPCVCFDSIPYEDIGKVDEDLLVAKSGNIADLTAKISFLVHSEERRHSLGDKALKIRERLSADVVYRLFEDVIR
jgi:GalNAc-alpha-(1->4)-GalNAc-alpha-(1->3)-diNAcBac-PP-undecaprenol alpha-1,4-N-acetyl-D-galactosaminyltransferase